MLIPCPVCGKRDHGEFTYCGDATVVRPDIADSDPAHWAAFVYDRGNPRGPHAEHWHHVHGCRHWLQVTRDTLTHDVHDARIVGMWTDHATAENS